MECRSIVVVASGEPEDAAVFATAAALAARLDAGLEIVPAYPDPAADYLAYGAALKRGARDVAAERLADAEREVQQSIERLASAAAASAGLNSERLIVEQRELQPAVAIASAAVLADLVLLGAGAAKGVLAGLFAETLISSRAPCLLVKGGEYRFGPAAIAWDASAQASRAVRAALPLLRHSEGVLVLHNREDEASNKKPAETGRLMRYLSAHGVDASAREIGGKNVALSLLETARSENCDLLVAGAFGRPRLYELVLGGTTRELADAAGPPHILLAH